MTPLQKLNLEETGPNVYRQSSDLPFLANEHVDFLVSDSEQSLRKRARICLHQSDDALVQEMLIAVQQESYIRPHRHINRSESMLALRGSALAVFFDERGSITDTLELSSDSLSIYRIENAIYHTLIPITKSFVFKESTQGPFHRSTTEFAPWAPELNDSTCFDWLKKLKTKCDAFSQT